MGLDACSTMVVQGPVRLRKVTSPVQGECTGCFFKDITCAECNTVSFVQGRLPCSAEDYVWEVASIG
jgi:hypothetical protein